MGSSSNKTRTAKDYYNLPAPRRVHVLGTGSVGKLVAYAIRGIPNPPPTTLLVHRPTYINDFEAAGRSISLTTKGVTDSRVGYDLELALPERRDLHLGHHVARDSDKASWNDYVSDEPIHNLVLSVKANSTISALSAIKHRLTPTSTILFLQNGMGVVEEVNTALFPDPTTRPNYMLGVNSHGVHSNSTFSVTHAGHGTIFLGLLPRVPLKTLADLPPEERDSVMFAPSSRYLLRTITRTPLLTAVALPPTELLQAQIEKLAVNCIINPLTVMLDGRNGDILHNFALTRTARLLLAEICLVLQSLPELRGVLNVKSRFSPERLEATMVSVAQRTAENISSMLQDVRRGMPTEVEYINGYIVKRGEEMGIRPVMNYMLMQMVIGKQQLIAKEIDNYMPFGYGKL